MQTTTPELVGFSSTRLKNIHTVMQKYVDDGKLAGLITCVARYGKILHLEKFGLMDIEAKKDMTFDTIFRIASMTKPITSVAIMQLYEQGFFNLNTPVYEFIPGFKDVKVFVEEKDSEIILEDLRHPITIRHLFTHTSGLSSGKNPKDPVDRMYQEARQNYPGPDPASLGDTINLITTLPLASQPGTVWRYGASIDVLGHIVEIISGLSFDQYLRENIFEPLGMVDTDFWVPPEKRDRLAALYGHPKAAKELTLIESPQNAKILTKPAFLAPGGGLVSTVSDYGQFAQMLVNGGALNGKRLLSPTTIEMYSVNHAPLEALPYGFSKPDYYHMGYGYSLGTRVLLDVSASGQAGSVGEFGWDGAFNTYFFVDPVQEMYGLLLTQHLPNNYYPIASTFKQLIYQSIVA
jgi:CubicO group peptidase (beta-lactamase class C family)